MRHLLRQALPIILSLLMLCTSCDGNVFITPEVSADMEKTTEELNVHLEKDSSIVLGEKMTLLDFVEDVLGDLNRGLSSPITDEEVTALASYLIPPESNMDLWIDIDSIPAIERKTMDALLRVEKPQDIEEVEKLLAKRVTGPAAEAVDALYQKILIPFFSDGSGSEDGLYAFRNVLRIPDSSENLTNGDYIAVQMILTLVLKTIPEAIFESYVEYVPPEDAESKMNAYLCEIGTNLIKALIVDDSTLSHIFGTYTFLNKYNGATTILDMRNLGQFFREGE